MYSMPPERTAGTTRPGSPSSCGTARRGRRRVRPEAATGTLRALPILLHRFFSTTHSSVGYGPVRVRGEQQACRPMASGEAGAGHPGGARRSHSSPARTVARDTSGSRATSTSYYGRRSPDLAPGLGDRWPILAVVGDAEIATRALAAAGDQAAFVERILEWVFILPGFRPRVAYGIGPSVGVYPRGGGQSTGGTSPSSPPSRSTARLRSSGLDVR